MSRLVFSLDVQGILLSAEAVAGDPTEEIWVRICGVGWISRALQKPRRIWGCNRGTWSQHHPSPKGHTDKTESGV